jgi:SH3-like domain-containing protein
MRTLIPAAAIRRSSADRCNRPSGLRQRLWRVIALAGFATAASLPGHAQTATAPSGLPVPRFVSLKSNPVNLRKGPGRQYAKGWIFRRAGLPVEVIQEYNNWRQVRDSEGVKGWVFHSLLSGRRTALVLPWEKRKGKKAALTNLHSAARGSSRVLARLEAGTLASIRSCTKSWCYVSIGRFRGYLSKERLWGVYPNEIIR